MHRLWVRKGLHLAIGLFAFGLVLGPLFAVLLTASMSVFNLWIWPHLGGRGLWRDPRGGRDIGIVAYPTVLFGLVLCFHQRLEIVAATWGILAFGDGMAAILGRSFGHRTLPWNADKTWVGSSAYAIFGTLGAAGLLVWMEPPKAEPRILFLLLVAAAASCLAAGIESLPLGLDDNFTAPPIAALLLWGLLSSREGWQSGELLSGELLSGELQSGELEILAQQAIFGALLALVLAGLAYRLGSVDVSGALAGWILATLITAFLFLPGLVILGAFFVLGSAATRFGLARKQRRGVAQRAAGRRSARNALANAGVPAVLAVLAVTTSSKEALVIAFVAAFAAATADTLSSEIGQLWGGRPVMITTWQTVAPGHDGGVTWVGSFAGLIGGLLVASLGWIVGFYGGAIIPWVVLASIVGNLLDSWLGATLERRGLLDNEGVNFAATLGASLFALGVASKLI